MTDGSQSERPPRVHDDLTTRIQEKIEELRADVRQLHTDIRAADEASARARRDRIEGLKKALHELLRAATKEDLEWH